MTGWLSTGLGPRVGHAVPAANTKAQAEGRKRERAGYQPHPAQPAQSSESEQERHVPRRTRTHTLARGDVDMNVKLITELEYSRTVRAGYYYMYLRKATVTTLNSNGTAVL